MKRFEPIDISGDAGIRAFGRNLPELFSNAAAGMLSLITDMSKVAVERQVQIAVEGSSPEGLLVSFLNELIFLFDTYGFLGKNISIASISGNSLYANVSGEDFDPLRHEGKLLIKAATYHRLKIEEKDGIWSADIIFDI